MANSIETTVGLNTGPLQQGFSKAEKMAESYANKVGKLGESAAVRNAEHSSRSFTRALRYGANDLARGNVVGGLEQFGSLGGEGLAKFAAGAGIAALVVNKLYETLSKAQEAALKMDESIHGVGMAANASGSFKGIADIETQARTAAATLDEMRQRDRSEARGPDGALSKFARHISTGTNDADDVRAKQNLLKSSSALIDQLAGKQKDLNDAEEQSVSGSERQSELLKEQIQHREKLGSIASLEASLGVRNSAARDEENRRDQQSLVAIERKYDYREREQSMADKVVNLERGSLSTSQQSLAVLKERIALLDTKLKGPATDEQRAALGTEREGLQNQAYRQQYAERDKGSAVRNAEQREQQRFSRFVRGQEPSNRNAYLNSPDAYKTSPDAYNGADSTDYDPNGRGYQTPTFTHQLGGLDKKMDVFGGSDSFNNFFKKRPGEPDDGSRPLKPVSDKKDDQNTQSAAILSILESWDK